MKCDEIATELVAYQFGTVEPEARDRIDGHLVECPSCVRAFVSLKRSVETSADVPSPPGRVRTRLRRAVAEELGLREPRWSWWERPLAIALAASVVLIAGATTRALTTTPGAAPFALTEGR